MYTKSGEEGRSGTARGGALVRCTVRDYITKAAQGERRGDAVRHRKGGGGSSKYSCGSVGDHAFEKHKERFWRPDSSQRRRRCKSTPISGSLWRTLGRKQGHASSVNAGIREASLIPPTSRKARHPLSLPANILNHMMGKERKNTRVTKGSTRQSGPLFVSPMSCVTIIPSPHSAS